MPTFIRAEMPERGFTLVELMVVLLILGLAATAVVLAARPANSAASDAARLAARVAAARDLAVTANRPIGLWVGRSGYGFDAWVGGDWQPLRRSPFEQRQWPGETIVETGGLAGRAAASADGTARVTFDNLGLPDATASIAIARSGSRATVAIAGDGGVSVR